MTTRTEEEREDALELAASKFYLLNAFPESFINDREEFAKYMNKSEKAEQTKGERRWRTIKFV